MPVWGPLRYLYVGTPDTGEAVAWYVRGGARLVWHVRAFGAEVAALRLGEGTLVLLADHRKPGTTLPIWEVTGLAEEVERLGKAGWVPHGDAFEVPDGPCQMFMDPAGNELCLLEARRPGAMEAAYADPANPNAVRPAVTRSAGLRQPSAPRRTRATAGRP